MPGLEHLVGLGLFLVLPVALLWLWARPRLTVPDRFAHMRAYAETHGLTFRALEVGGGCVLFGRVRGLDLHVGGEWIVVDGDPDTIDRSYRSTVRVELRDSLPGGLVLSSEDCEMRLAKALGATDHETGDARFDAAVVVEGREEEVRAFLRDGPLRGAIVRMVSRWPSAKIIDNAVEVDLVGLETVPVAVLQDAVQLAEALQAAVRRHRAAAEEVLQTPGALPVRARFPATEPEATLAAWRADVGDAVERGQPLCELLTGQGTLVVVAPAAGEIVRRLGGPGRTLKNGGLLVEIEAATGEHLPAQPKPPNASGLELLDLDQVSLHRADEEQAAKDPRLDVDSPRPPRERPWTDAAGVDPAARERFAGVSWTALAASLSDPVLLTSQRTALLAPARGAVHTVELLVTQVGWTTGMLLAKHLQGGRTIAGHFDGGAPEVTVRMPAADNESLDSLRCGGEDWLTVRVRLRDWDALHRRLVFDAVDKTVTGGGSPPS